MTTTDWPAFFDEKAPRYEDEAFGGAGLAAVSGREIAAVRGALAGRRPGAVLDAGAGTGRVTSVMRRLGWDVTALDASTAMLGQLHRAEPGVPRVHARLGDPLPFGARSFDAVVSMRVLKYVEAFDLALAEFARVLRPGGVAVFEIANRRSIARLGYPDAVVYLRTVGQAEGAMRAAGIEPVARVAGTRLPHRAFARARSRRAARVVVACDRAAGALLGGDTSGARSVMLVGYRS